MTKGFMTMAGMLALFALLVVQGRVSADEKKEEQKRVVTVRVEKVEVDTQATAEAGAEGEKKKVEVRAIVLGGHVADIEKALKESGLEGEQLKKVRAAVEKALKNAHVTPRVLKAGDGQMRLRTLIPQMQLIGPHEKPRKIEVKVLSEDDAPKPHQVIVQQLDGEISEKVKESLKEAHEKLKDHGLKEEQLKKIHAAIEQALKNHPKHQHMVVAVEAAKAKLAGQRYMIGVECAEVDDKRRSKVDLEEGVGILVNSVFADSPAAKAGIKKSDILVRVGEAELKDAKQLIHAVQAAGKGKKKLSLTIVRGDDEKTVVVEPNERKALGLFVADGTELKPSQGRMVLELKDGEPAKTEQRRMVFSFGPGVITEKKEEIKHAQAAQGEVKKLRQQVETLTKQVKELQAALKKLKSEKN